jgi:hypothetical protein
MDVVKGPFFQVVVVAKPVQQQTMLVMEHGTSVFITIFISIASKAFKNTHF